MRLRTRTWIALAAAASIALVCTWWTAFGGSDIVLPQAELQQKIDSKLPFVTKSDLTIAKADLDLAGDKLGLTVTASAPLGHSTYKVEAKTSGRLSYDNSKGQFFFHPEALKVVSVESFKGTMQGTAPTLIDKVPGIEKLRSEKNTILTDGAQLVQDKVEKAASVALDRVPVYTLPNNFKGHVALMALSSVEIKNGTIIAHMSFLQFTGMALLYCGMFLMVLLIGGVLVVAAVNGAELPFFFI